MEMRNLNDLLAGVEVLKRTPATLDHLLRGLPDELARGNEGGETWSPFDIVGHLIHGEKTDWIPRINIILQHGEAQPFTPFDRFAQFESSKGKSLQELLDEFSVRRKQNLDALLAITFTDQTFQLCGMHRVLGKVTMGQLLASWVVHDLNHINQISRVMAKQYTEAIGPWTQFMGVLSH